MEFRLNGYLTKYLHLFNEQWRKKKGFPFSGTWRSKFIEVYHILRYCEKNRHNTRDMITSIKIYASDLFAIDFNENNNEHSSLEQAFTSYILLFANIHAFVARNGETAKDIIWKIGVNTGCKEIFKIFFFLISQV